MISKPKEERDNPLIKGHHGVIGLLALALVTGAFYMAQLMVADPDDTNSYAEGIVQPVPEVEVGDRLESFQEWQRGSSAGPFTLELSEQDLASIVEQQVKNGFKNYMVHPRIKLNPPDGVSLFMVFRLRRLGGGGIYVRANGKVEEKDGKLIASVDEVRVGRLKVRLIDGMTLLGLWINIGGDGIIPIPQDTNVKNLKAQEGSLIITISRR